MNKTLQLDENKTTVVVSYKKLSKIYENFVENGDTKLASNLKEMLDQISKYIEFINVGFVKLSKYIS